MPRSTPTVRRYCMSPPGMPRGLCPRGSSSPASTRRCRGCSCCRRGRSSPPSRGDTRGVRRRACTCPQRTGMQRARTSRARGRGRHPR
jgi:hypothetical protein